MKYLFIPLLIVSFLSPLSASAAATCAQGTLNTEGFCVTPANNGANTICPDGSTLTPNPTGGYYCASNPIQTDTPMPTCPTGQVPSYTDQGILSGGCELAPGNNGAPSTPTAAQNTTVSNPSANTSSDCPNGGTKTPQMGCNLGYTPLEPIPGVNVGANGQALDFPHLLGNVYKIAIIIGALFSVLMLTLSGIRYMVSEVVTDKDKAKKRIRACLFGLVLIAASWLILNTINPQLVTFTLSPGQQTINVSTANPNSYAGPAPAIVQLSPAQISQNNLTGKLQDTSSLTYGSTPPSSDMINSYTKSCEAKGGVAAGNQLGGGFICETPQAYSADPVNQTATP